MALNLVFDCDFGFAFNNAHFSDRLLRIEIINGGEITNDGEITNVDLVQDSKRMRKDIDTRAIGGENEKEGMSLTTPNPPALRVTELHISSLLLAAKSPFFFKLFSNGMIESEQKHVTLRIEAYEEAAVMELLNFMYTNSLSSVNEVPALLRLLVAADKFEVTSCMKYCARMLLNIPMTLPCVLRILHLPWTLLLADSVKPLTNAARHFLIMHYKDISKFPLEELMDLPLAGIMTLLMSNDLMVASEDMVYEVALKWVKANYPVVEERHKILGNLARYIRFPYMSSPRLKNIMTSDDFEPDAAYKIVLEPIVFRAEPLPHRAYTYRPIKTLELEVPHRQCIVYLDLTRKECNDMYTSDQICSQKFPFGGQEFMLLARYNQGQLNGFHSFGLFLSTQQQGSVSLIVDCELSARWKPTQEFVIRSKGRYKFTGAAVVGYKDLFGIPWASFIGEDSPYFINDILHLRADLSIRL